MATCSRHLLGASTIGGAQSSRHRIAHAFASRARYLHAPEAYVTAERVASPMLTPPTSSVSAATRASQVAGKTPLQGRSACYGLGEGFGKITE